MRFERIDYNNLKQTALSARESIIRMSTNGGAFIGASLSCVDILVYLYKYFLNVNSNNLKDPSRDYLFLSKGHDVPALYSVFAEVGIIEKERLKNHLQTNDSIYWHPNREIPGIEFHSGSLGHLLSVGLGIAIDSKRKKISNKIVVVLGDGELNEGSVWECFLTASAFKQDNLIAVIDRNHFQANMKTEELIPLESLEKKLEAFGWNVISCNGHDFVDLHETFSNLNLKNCRPSAIICETVRGKGLPSIEAKADRWFCNFSEAEIENLLVELYTGEETILISQTLIAR